MWVWEDSGEMGKVVEKASAPYQTLLSKQAELGRKEDRRNRGRVPALPRPVALPPPTVTLVTVGSSGCPGGPSAAPEIAPWPYLLPGVALFLTR